MMWNSVGVATVQQHYNELQAIVLSPLHLRSHRSMNSPQVQSLPHVLTFSKLPYVCVCV